MNKIISSNSTSNLSRRTYFEIVDRLRSTNSQVQYFESVTLTVENDVYDLKKLILTLSQPRNINENNEYYMYYKDETRMIMPVVYTKKLNNF
ncbi:hypothetical protein H8356DRAFT_1338521 [Neocallimastix lanati (nom. inval.)]|nr:hypothetical protein H8356DRAFT_1338521 [Neocallimastix sp. JGI-2020a]